MDGPSDRFLRIYFIVQDIHERLSSSHYRYQELASHFERSDVLFRFKHLLQAYASECRSIGRALQLGIPFERSQHTTLALDELQASMAALREKNNPVWKDSLSQLQFLFNNLCTVDQLFNNINNPDASNAENHLDDRTAHTAAKCGKTCAQR